MVFQIPIEENEEKMGDSKTWTIPRHKDKDEPDGMCFEDNQWEVPDHFDYKSI